MPTHPAPTIANNLALIQQRLDHSQISHVSEVTYAFVNNAGTDAASLVDAFQNHFVAAFQSLFDSEVTIEPAYVQLGDGTNVPTVAIASGAAVNGTNAFDGPPPQVCALLKKVTNAGGKANRGRTYMPFVLPDDNIHEDGTIDSSTYAALTTAATAFLTAMTGDQLDMVIANKTLVVDPITHKPYVTHIGHSGNVVSYSCEHLVATQRRRLARA